MANLAQDDDVRPDAVVVAREQPACPGDSRLDFVANKEDIVLREARVREVQVEC